MFDQSWAARHPCICSAVTILVLLTAFCCVGEPGWKGILGDVLVFGMLVLTGFLYSSFVIRARRSDRSGVRLDWRHWAFAAVFACAFFAYLSWPRMWVLVSRDKEAETATYRHRITGASKVEDVSEGRQDYEEEKAGDMEAVRDFP